MISRKKIKHIITYRSFTSNNLSLSEDLKKYNVNYDHIWYHAPKIIQTYPFDIVLCMIWTPPLVQIPRFSNILVSWFGKLDLHHDPL